MRVRTAWISPFVLGAATATSAAIAVALLLYSGEGMLRSLTLIVAVELIALAVGLGGLHLPASPAVADLLRKRWIWMLVAFSTACVFTIVWTLGRGFRADPRAQALGLALLGGLPVYACGRLLVTVSAIGSAAGRAGSGGMAALGAAVGVLVTGSGGLSRLGAPSLMLFFLILLSGAALIQGSVLIDAKSGSS